MRLGTLAVIALVLAPAAAVAQGRRHRDARETEA